MLFKNIDTKKTILMIFKAFAELKNRSPKMHAFPNLQSNLWVKKTQENGWRKVKSEQKRS